MAPPYPPLQTSEFLTEMYPNVEEHPLMLSRRDYFGNDPRSMAPPYPPPQTSEFLSTTMYPNVGASPLQFPRRDYFGNDRCSMAPQYPLPQISEYPTRVMYSNVEENPIHFAQDYFGNDPRSMVPPYPPQTSEFLTEMYPNVEENPLQFLRRDYFENDLQPAEYRKRPLHEDPSSKSEFAPPVLDNVPEEKENYKKRICRWKACGKQFSEQDEFIDHVEAHVKEDAKIRKCLWEGCSHTKPFHKNYFLDHVRKHLGRRPYACVEPGCHKTCFHSVDMVLHGIRVHDKKIENSTQRPEEPKRIKDATQFPRKNHLENDRHMIPREEECRQAVTVELGGKVYSVIGAPPRKPIGAPQETPEESEPVKDVTKSPRQCRKIPLPEDPFSKSEFAPGPRLSKYGKRIGRPPGTFKLRRPLPDDVSEEKEDERICRWKACGKQFTEQDEFINHVYAHINKDKKCRFRKSNWERCCRFRKCHWEGCRHVEPFNTCYKLEIHVQRHCGQKPYVCKEPGCNKAYAHMKNLQTHRSVHTGERPFECSICEKKFTNKSDAAKHEKRVHGGKKQYQCGVETCGKSYTDPSALRKHFRLHHPELFKEFKAGKHRVYIRRDEEEQ